MGVLCCKPEYDKDSVFPPKTTTTNDEDPQDNTTRNYQGISTLDLSRLITRQQTDFFFAEIQKTLSDPEVRQPNNFFLKHSLSLLKNKLRVWIKFESKKKTSKTKIQTRYSEMSIPFTPDLIFLYLLTIDETNFQKLHEDLESYEILNRRIRGSFIYILYKYTTKKTSTISKRSYLVFWILKNNEDGTIDEFQTSVNTTQLKHIKAFKTLIGNPETQAVLYVAGSSFEQKKDEETFIWKRFRRGDLPNNQTTIGLKKTLKTKIKDFNTKLMQQIVHFLLDPPNSKDLFWFGGAKTSREVIDKNIGILGRVDIGVQDLDNASRELFAARFSWKKKKNAEEDEGKKVDKEEEEGVYESIEQMNDEKDNLFIGLDTRLMSQTNDLKKKVADFRNDSLNLSVNDNFDDKLKNEIVDTIEKMTLTIDKRSSKTREILEDSINSGSFVEDIERKINSDFKRLNGAVNEQMQRVIKGRKGRKKDEERKLGDRKELMENVIEGDDEDWRTPEKTQQRETDK